MFAALVQVPPVPVTVSAGLVPVLLSRMLLAAPLFETRWKVSGVALPIRVRDLRRAAGGAVDRVRGSRDVERVVRVGEAEALRRDAPAARRVDVETATHDSVSVWPSPPLKTTASPATVLSVFVALLKVIEPPVLFDTMMPPPASPVSFTGPAKLTDPPLRPVTSAVWPGRC